MAGSGSDDPEIIDLSVDEISDPLDTRESMQCVFTWSIKNFSYNHEESDEGLSSPIFADNAGDRWFVTVFPNGVRDYDQYVSVHVAFLTNSSSPSRDREQVFCEVAVLDKSSRKWAEASTVRHRADLGQFEFNALATRDSLVHDSEKVLPGDKLTLCCQLCENKEVQPQPTVRQLIGSPELRKFSDDFRALYKSGRFTDVSLVLKDGTLKAHKIILVNRSSEFARRLTLPNVSELHMPDMMMSTMDALLSYIYTGEIDTSCKVLPLDLYQAAKKFEVAKLEHAIMPSRVFAETEVVKEQFSYTWRVKNFSVLNTGRLIYSSKFHTGPNEIWSLSLQLPPSEATTDEVGVYLNKLWRANDKKSVFVKFKIYVLDKSQQKRFPFQTEKCFRLTNRHGTPSFFRKSQLLGDRDNLLPDDVLIVRCEMSAADMRCLSKIQHSYSSSTTSLSEISDLQELSDCFRHLLNSNEHTDVEIKCAGKNRFRLHKAILCARSPMFANFFQSQDIALKEFTIDISGITFPVLELLFLLIYSGKVQGLTGETAEGLFTAATYYEIAESRDAFSRYLRSNLTTENAFHLLILSSTMADPALKNLVMDFICSNVAQLVNGPQWIPFQREHPEAASQVLNYLADGYRESKRRRMTDNGA